MQGTLPMPEIFGSYLFEDRKREEKGNIEMSFFLWLLGRAGVQAGLTVPLAFFRHGQQLRNLPEGV